MRANEFLYETIEIVSEKTSSDELIDVLSKAGYEVKKDTGRTVKVLVPTRERGSKAQEIVKILSGRPVPPNNETVPATSNKDIVKYDGATIKVKPVERQGGNLAKEMAQIDAIASEIKKHLGDEPFINLTFGDKIVHASGILKVDGSVKADAEIVDENGLAVAWISLKDGKTPKHFGQWGGVTHFGQNPDVVKFAQHLKALFPTGMPNEVTYGMEITDPKLKAKVCFGKDYGGDFGRSNVDLILQGTPTIKKGPEDTYFLAGAHTWLNGNVPSGEYDPVLTARFASGRNDFGIPGARITAFTTGGRNWKPLPEIDTAQQPEEPQPELEPQPKLEPPPEAAALPPELDPAQQVPTEPIEPTEPVDQEIPKKKQRLGYSRQGKEKEPVLEELISILKNAGIR